MTPKQRAAIIRHGEQLNAIFNTGLDPLTLCKKLRRIEGAANKLAVGLDCCNTLSLESMEAEKRLSRIKGRVAAALGETWSELERQGVFINLDPRGYALKIDDEYMRAHSLKLHTDWGGFGVLAPEFGKDGN